MSFIFGSPGYKSRENDLVPSIKRRPRPVVSPIVLVSNNNNNNTNLQWVDGKLYNNTLLYNNKIWSN